jgi:hypothetical protein
MLKNYSCCLSKLPGQFKDIMIKYLHIYNACIEKRYLQFETLVIACLDRNRTKILWKKVVIQLALSWYLQVSMEDEMHIDEGVRFKILGTDAIEVRDIGVHTIYRLLNETWSTKISYRPLDDQQVK